MDFQLLFNLVVGVGLPALGWALRTMVSDIREVSKDLTTHKVEAAKEYATKDELSGWGERMDVSFRIVGEKIDRVLERLERKADR